MNKIILTFSIFLSAQALWAQSYSLTDLEAHFLAKNSLLIAQKYNINKAEAEIIQEKLWTNPTLTISEFNLWKTYDIEEQPYLFGRYGKNQQVAVELEQLIETAGKRKKRVAIRNLEKNESQFAYEELLRELKKDLRQTFYNLARIYEQQKQLTEVVLLFEQLDSQYERQSQKQNISKADYYRVQTELTSLQKEQVELDDEKLEELTKLQVLTHLPNLSFANLIFPIDERQLSTRLPIELTTLAVTNNIGLKRQNNELTIAERQFDLEMAQRKPDVTVGVNYDRGGNIMKDFVGLGVSMDLPIFNRNKGNIKAAQFQIQQEQSNLQSMQWELENSVIRLQNKLRQYELALEKTKRKETEGQAEILKNYHKHLQTSQVTLLEFIDFTQAFRQAKQTYFELLADYHNTYEELQYVVGQDF